MLRNRKTDEANKLLGVNLSAEDTDLELGTFTRLENWIPADLFALKKKRGSIELESAETETLEPVEC